ncbi:hypothetical protein CO046_04720 [Candidatus Peregrinibacteria bacterium CG_4_9_14_0_2_um_filter_53_11]|nr:MAG: hypothetical protein CO046_04720 [Candidatus Peregrinibacteria bacterium CG_4_9_14_0_2_um_filter_53_11]
MPAPERISAGIETLAPERREFVISRLTSVLRTISSSFLEIGRTREVRAGSHGGLWGRHAEAKRRRALVGGILRELPVRLFNGVGDPNERTLLLDDFLKFISEPYRLEVEAFLRDFVDSSNAPSEGALMRGIQRIVNREPVPDEPVFIGESLSVLIDGTPSADAFRTSSGSSPSTRIRDERDPRKAAVSSVKGITDHLLRMRGARARLVEFPKLVHGVVLAPNIIIAGNLSPAERREAMVAVLKGLRADINMSNRTTFVQSGLEVVFAEHCAALLDELIALYEGKNSIDNHAINAIWERYGFDQVGPVAVDIRSPVLYSQGVPTYDSGPPPAAAPVALEDDLSSTPLPVDVFAEEVRPRRDTAPIALVHVQETAMGVADLPFAPGEQIHDEVSDPLPHVATLSPLAFAPINTSPDHPVPPDVPPVAEAALSSVPPVVTTQTSSAAAAAPVARGPGDPTQTDSYFRVQRPFDRAHPGLAIPGGTAELILPTKEEQHAYALLTRRENLLAQLRAGARTHHDYDTAEAAKIDRAQNRLAYARHWNQALADQRQVSEAEIRQYVHDELPTVVEEMAENPAYAKISRQALHAAMIGLHRAFIALGWSQSLANRLSGRLLELQVDLTDELAGQDLQKVTKMYWDLDGVAKSIAQDRAELLPRMENPGNFEEFAQLCRTSHEKARTYIDRLTDMYLEVSGDELPVRGDASLFSEAVLEPLGPVDEASQRVVDFFGDTVYQQMHFIDGAIARVEAARDQVVAAYKLGALPLPGDFEAAFSRPLQFYNQVRLTLNARREGIQNGVNQEEPAEDLIDLIEDSNSYLAQNEALLLATSDAAVDTAVEMIKRLPLPDLSDDHTPAHENANPDVDSLWTVIGAGLDPGHVVPHLFNARSVARLPELQHDLSPLSVTNDDEVGLEVAVASGQPVELPVQEPAVAASPADLSPPADLSHPGAPLSLAPSLDTLFLAPSESGEVVEKRWGPRLAHIGRGIRHRIALALAPAGRALQPKVQALRQRLTNVVSKENLTKVTERLVEPVQAGASRLISRTRLFVRENAQIILLSLVGAAFAGSAAHYQNSRTHHGKSPHLGHSSPSTDTGQLKIDDDAVRISVGGMPAAQAGIGVGDGVQPGVASDSPPRDIEALPAEVTMEAQLPQEHVEPDTVANEKQAHPSLHTGLTEMVRALRSGELKVPAPDYSRGTTGARAFLRDGHGPLVKPVAFDRDVLLAEYPTLKLVTVSLNESLTRGAQRGLAEVAADLVMQRAQSQGLAVDVNKVKKLARTVVLKQYPRGESMALLAQQLATDVAPNQGLMAQFDMVTLNGEEVPDMEGNLNLGAPGLTWAFDTTAPELQADLERAVDGVFAELGVQPKTDAQKAYENFRTRFGGVLKNVGSSVQAALN